MINTASFADWGNIAMGALIIPWNLCHLNKCYEVPEMKCADVQKPVEKTVHDTQYEIVSEKDCRVEQENVCHSVTEMYEQQSRISAAVPRDSTVSSNLYLI